IEGVTMALRTAAASHISHGERSIPDTLLAHVAAIIQLLHQGRSSSSVFARLTLHDCWACVTEYVRKVFFPTVGTHAMAKIHVRSIRDVSLNLLPRPPGRPESSCNRSRSAITHGEPAGRL